MLALPYDIRLSIVRLVNNSMRQRPAGLKEKSGEDVRQLIDRCMTAKIDFIHTHKSFNMAFLSNNEC